MSGDREFKCIPKKEAREDIYLAYIEGQFVRPNPASNSWEACFNLIKPRINTDNYYLRELEKNGYVECNKNVYGIGKIN